MEKTLSLFCKIARRNSNPAELALTYVKEKSNPSLGARILGGLKSSLNLSIQIICGICDIGADRLHGLAWLTMLGNG